MTNPGINRLPPVLHEAMQPDWSQEDQVAKLLGRTLLEPSTSEYVGIPELPNSLHKDVGFYELSEETERKAAATALVTDLVTLQRPSNLIVHEALMQSLIVEHIIGNRLYCTDDVLQAVINNFVGNTAATRNFSPLLSVWASFQRGILGERQMTIAWPSVIKDKRVHLGSMMHDVDLKITGRMKAEIAEDSNNCRLELDRFEGKAGIGARNLALSAKTFKGSVLRGAEDSGLECSRLRLTEKAILGSGCAIKAEAVQGIIGGIPAERYESYVPPVIEITRLTGTVMAQPSWWVEIGNITRIGNNTRQRLIQSDSETALDGEGSEAEINSILERAIVVNTFVDNIGLRGVSQILAGMRAE